MANRTENIETALTGRDLKTIVTDLQGISTGALVATKVVSSYGFTVGGVVDTTNGGINLDAVTRDNNGTSEVVQVFAREIITTSGTLQKAALRIYLFDSYALSLASGDAFAFGVGGTAKNNVEVLDIAEADWKSDDPLVAVASVAYTGKNIRTAAGTTAMKAIVVMESSSKTYSANHALQLEIRIKRD